LEDGLGHGQVKRFEPALRIRKGHPHHQAGDGVETATKKLAVELLLKGL
jgi:hypothetical protein